MLSITDLRDNLVLCDDGSAWAIWRVFPDESARSTGENLRRLYEKTVGWTKQLRGQSVIASLTEELHPHEVINKCLKGVDLSKNDAWAETMYHAYDQLENLDLRTRNYWVAIPLYTDGIKDFAETTARSMRAGMMKKLGIPGHRASDKLLTELHRRSHALQSELGNSIPMRPATAAEVLWWICRAPTRGVSEPQMDHGQVHSDDPIVAVYNTGMSIGRSKAGAAVTALRDTLLDEGGRTDLVGARKAFGPLTTFNRRYLKCVTESPGEDPRVSYQAFLMLAEMPARFAFPGSEILARLGEIGCALDYVLRIDAISNERARVKNRRRTANLLGQDEEHGGDLAGVPADLQDAQEEQQDKNARLGASSTEIELEVGVIACVWGDTPEVCQDRANLVRTAFAASEYKWERPLGGQEELYWAMLPGSRTPTVVKNYSQNLLASDMATMLPFSSEQFGDPYGALFGLGLDSGALTPFLFDPTYGPSKDSPGGVAAIGALGSGKSVLLKNLAAVVRLRHNGRVIAVDRTDRREWIPVAEELPGKTQIVDIIDPGLDDKRTVSAKLQYSCDPLRVFGGGSTGIAETFFGAWLDLESACAERDSLGEALQRISGPDASSKKLAELLVTMGEQGDRAAAAIGKKLQRLAKDPITRCIFDDTLPTVDLVSADFVVFCTNEAPLPTSVEMNNQRLAARVNMRKLFGRAVHLLIAAIARKVCFESDRWGEFIVDEAHAVTGTPEGNSIMIDFVRDGRKHGADAAFGSHDKEDLGDERLRGLISAKFLGRHADRELARSGLEFLGLDPDDEDLISTVQGLSPIDPPGGEEERRARAGEFLALDHAQRRGRVKILNQPWRNLAEAVLTTPKISTGVEM